MSSEKWEQLTLAQQLGNIGSAFARGVKSNNFDEALVLLDLTISDKRWTRRLKELTRLREVLCDQVLDTKNYQIETSTLNDYFLSFGVIARNAL